jgi:hypothetical protein
MPGLGQGHGKKRHLHAHSPVNFKELKCYYFSYFYQNLKIINLSMLVGTIGRNRYFLTKDKRYRGIPSDH